VGACDGGVNVSGGEQVKGGERKKRKKFDNEVTRRGKGHKKQRPYTETHTAPNRHRGTGGKNNTMVLPAQKRRYCKKNIEGKERNKSGET